MAVTERFNYIEYSDSTKFFGDSTGRIQLADYPNELMLVASFDSEANADFSRGTEAALTYGTVSIENFGVFGQHVLIGDSGYVRFDENNFDDLTTEGSIKFRFRPGFNNGFGYQEFTTTTDPTIAGDTNYGFTLTVDGTLFGDTDVSLSTGDSMIDIMNAINLAISGSDATATVLVGGNIRITADDYGDSILISAPSSGNSLITLLTSIGTSYLPNPPAVDTEIFGMYNGSGDTNRISIIHDTDGDLLFRMYDNTGDTIVNENIGVLSNHYLNWNAIEIDWNTSIAQFHLNGTHKTVSATGFSRGTGTYLYLQSSDNVGDTYRFDELIVYNEYQNTKSYTVETTALSQYADDDPYIDVHFGTGFIDGEVTDLNLTCSSDCRFVVKIGAAWYYYLSGAWRVSDGTYSQSVTPTIMETQFTNITFNEDAELVIRVYFHSDGETLVYLDNIEILTETGAAETAIITGTIDLSDGVDLSSVYNITITTGSGSEEVDVSDGAVDDTAVTLAEIQAAIDAAEITGLASATDDGDGHLVLQTTATGDDASIAVSSGTTYDALATVWGYEATDAGLDAVGSSADYSELFRYVRSKLGEPLIPAEITDEQLEDCLSDAIFHYNRRKNYEERILSTTLSGSSSVGYEIPTTVGGSDNIIEIILRPRFPFTYYAGRTDIVSNLYVQYLFQRYKSGFSEMLTDYYVAITTEDDINTILGTQLKWEIINGRLFIWPPPDDLSVIIRYRGALTASEIVTNYWIKRLVLAEAKIVLGNIRSTFKSGIPGGAEMLQLNGEDLKAEGLQEKEVILEDISKSQEPLFLEFF